MADSLDKTVFRNTFDCFDAVFDNMFGCLDAVFDNIGGSFHRGFRDVVDGPMNIPMGIADKFAEISEKQLLPLCQFCRIENFIAQQLVVGEIPLEAGMCSTCKKMRCLVYKMLLGMTYKRIKLQFNKVNKTSQSSYGDPTFCYSSCLNLTLV